jgi:hypothetical protein
MGETMLPFIAVPIVGGTFRCPHQRWLPTIATLTTRQSARIVNNSIRLILRAAKFWQRMGWATHGDRPLGSLGQKSKEKGRPSAALVWSIISGSDCCVSDPARVWIRHSMCAALRVPQRFVVIVMHRLITRTVRPIPISAPIEFRRAF